MIDSRHKAKHSSLIKMRENFIPEMLRASGSCNHNGRRARLSNLLFMTLFPSWKEAFPIFFADKFRRISSSDGPLPCDNDSGLAIAQVTHLVCFCMIAGFLPGRATPRC